MESNEKLRIKITQQSLKVEQLQKELSDVRERQPLSDLHGGALNASTASMEGKGWKSSVLTRMYEGKLKTLEADLEKKVLVFSLK